MVEEKPEIVVHGTKEKPYFEIKYKEVGNDDYTLGYSSYDLNNCFQWLEEEFEVVPEEKVVHFPVSVDEMQRNIMIGLLNARKECTEENLLTARGCVAIIDALFFLVKEDRVTQITSYCSGTLEDRNVICKVTGNYCTACTSGPCDSRREINEKNK